MQIMKSRKGILAVLAGLVVVALVAIIAVVNFSSTATANAAQAAQAQPTVTIPPAAQAKVDEYNRLLEQFRKNFAGKLGVDEAKLDSAFAGSVSDTLDQLVKDGKISQQQANTIKAITGNGLKGLSLPFPQSVTDQLKNSMPFNMEQLRQVEAKVAATLGLTTGELEAQLFSGKSLAEIAAAQKVEVSTLKTSIQDAITTQVNDAVKTGKLTQAQADQFTRFLPMVLDKLINAHMKAF
jgi:polyhydroxyalkanoate synthesis regulator phasin